MAGPAMLDTFISLSVVLQAAAVVSQGMGDPLYIAIEAATPISGALTSVTSVTDVATLLAATQISAAAAADLNRAFAQANPPSVIYVATYDAGGGEDPTDALDAVEAAMDFGPIAQESRSDTNNELVGAWVNASTARRWRHATLLQSAEATLLTSGKPAGLADCEVESVTLCYDVDAGTSAAALFGVIAGGSFATQPYPMQNRVIGVTAPTVTQSQLTFARANDVAVVVPIAQGSSSNIVYQTRNYSGDEAAAVWSIIYAIVRMRAALSAMVANNAAASRILRADPTGEAMVAATLTAPLASMAAAGHFLPGTSGTAPNEVDMPEGYSVSVAASGTELNATVRLRFGPEATKINLNITGEIIVSA